MKRTPLLMVLALTLVACDGAGGGEQEESEAAAASQPAQSDSTGAEPSSAASEAPAESEGGGDPGPASDVSVASVTIGGETYEFQSTGFPAERCDPAFFGGAHVVLVMADENGEVLYVNDSSSGVTIALIPEEVDDTQVPAVSVSLAENDTDWYADPGRFGAEESSVDSWSIDGNHIQGTATFYSSTGEGPVQGSFEATCVE
jgi:hypothetical protein